MSRFVLQKITLPQGSDENLRKVVAQFNNSLRVVENELNRITQDANIKNSTRLYFLPRVNAMPGYKLVYTTELDSAGNLQPSAEWVP